jgi:DNA repair exonuclease SbcCD ATPase subunit
MKKITLKSLSLENWRAMSLSFEFAASGKTIIRGENGTGKSHVVDAFLWLLTGVDALGRSNYDLFDRTKDFTPENAIPAVVKAEFVVDGYPLTVQRSAKQKWTRPRGKAEYVKDKSDEYKYFIDDLEVSANDFKARIEETFMEIEKLKLATNVRAIQSLDWQKRRKHFADMVGEIKDEELQGDYSAIADLLRQYKGTEGAKAKLSQLISPLKKQEDEILADIKATRSLLPDLSQCDEAEKQINDKKARIQEIDSEITGIGEANKPFIEKRKKEEAEIAEKRSLLAKAKAEYELKVSDSLSEERQKLSLAQAERKAALDFNASLSKEKKSIENDILSAKADVEYLTEAREELKKQKEEAKAREFSYNNICPTCGQQLPYDEEKVSQARRKFNDAKEKEIEAIVTKGKATRARLDERKARVEELEAKLSQLAPREVPDTTALERDFEARKLATAPFEATQRYIYATQEIEELTKALTTIPEAEDTTALTQEKQQILSDIEMLSKVVARREEYARAEQRIEQKQTTLRENGIEKARLEGLLENVLQREREWADIVRTRANQYLTCCHVEMTELSKSGELVDICSISIEGVDINTTNTARKIIAGVDIARAFMKKYGVELPLLIDNAEQITPDNLPTHTGQMIALYVDERYRELTLTEN